MIFLPIVERELRIRSRWKSTYRSRVLGALIAIVVAMLLLMLGEIAAAPAKFGAVIFTALGWMAFLYCLLEGPRNTADCLSEEKRAGTLGLLFLTDLKGHDVVLGKLMATSLNSFYALLAVFPPLALPLLLGGVAGGEFWRLVLVLLNTLFFSLAAGLFVSSVSWDERKAALAAFGIIALFAVLAPLGTALPFASTAVLAWASPTSAFLSLYDAAYASNPARFWQSLTAVHLSSWGFLIAACVLLPRTWQDRPRERVSRRTPLRFGVANWRHQRRLEGNPVAWVAQLAPGQKTLLWILIVVACLPALVVVLLAPASRATGIVLLMGALAVHLVVTVWVAAHACYLMADARNLGLLELILSTPLRTREIVRGYFLALQDSVVLPIGTLLLVEAALTTAHLFAVSANGGDTALPLVIAAAVVAMLVFDLHAAAWFGLWMGLRSKKAGHALAKTILIVLVLPLLGLCFGPLWPFIVMMKDMILINYARDELQRRFRPIVIERFALAGPATAWTPDERRLPPTLPSVVDR